VTKIIKNCVTSFIDDPKPFQKKIDILINSPCRYEEIYFALKIIEKEKKCHEINNIKILSTADASNTIRLGLQLF
jgi:hypothetical protein